MSLKVAAMSTAIAFVAGVALTGCATPATPATACPAAQATFNNPAPVANYKGEARCKGMARCKGKAKKVVDTDNDNSND